MSEFTEENKQPTNKVGSAPYSNENERNHTERRRTNIMYIPDDTAVVSSRLDSDPSMNDVLSSTMGASSQNFLNLNANTSHNYNNRLMIAPRYIQGVGINITNNGAANKRSE